ncbi:Ribosomal RNA small subunit methyltransferase E [Candidatus Desulfarcum epimagneticum]|uniref:Ribosomal RNA small subunit methyltransferase E n=1 Tax=uncultured Desulfobacteraceae bacterium TaxID=218296 RepID=A0A484HGF1_9BACT|nr:Ribosomal RNA small subunit methyltransferase E [uncultured Desulfobacteraceae bacterium]
MRYFHLEKIPNAGSPAVVTGSEARHMSQSLRLKTGDVIGLYDGSGRKGRARIAGFSEGRVRVEITEVSVAPESFVQITAALGILKGKKMDRVIRSLAELGVFRAAPFFSRRSARVPVKGRMESKKERWEKIAREAMKQSRGGRMMEIGPPGDFQGALDAGRTCDLKLIFWEEEKTGLGQALEAAFPQAPPRPRTVMVMLGPEGGFEKDEADMARRKGFVPASLGPRILKAETAAIAACVLAQHLFGDMG